MESKPHHKRHRRFLQRNRGLFFAGFLLVIVPALLVAFLWLVNRP
jgi:hypothetical protein